MMEVNCHWTLGDMLTDVGWHLYLTRSKNMEMTG